MRSGGSCWPVCFGGRYACRPTRTRKRHVHGSCAATVWQPMRSRCDYWGFVRRQDNTSHLDAQWCRPQPVWREADVDVTLIEIYPAVRLSAIIPALEEIVNDLVVVLQEFRIDQPQGIRLRVELPRLQLPILDGVLCEPPDVVRSHKVDELLHPPCALSGPSQNAFRLKPCILRLHGGFERKDSPVGESPGRLGPK